MVHRKPEHRFSGSATFYDNTELMFSISGWIRFTKIRQARRLLMGLDCTHKHKNDLLYGGEWGGAGGLVVLVTAHRFVAR